MRIRVPLEYIDANPFQMREQMGDIEGLAHRIRQAKRDHPETSGLIQVPPARLIADDGDPVDLDVLEDFPEISEGQWPSILRIQLAAGHRRLAAFRWLHEEYRKVAGQVPDRTPSEYGTFPVDLQELGDESMALAVWRENNDRQDITPVERAREIEAMQERFDWTQKTIAQKIGVSASVVSNSLRLLRLPAEVLKVVDNGAIGDRHARALLPLQDAGLLDDLFPDILTTAASEFRTAKELEQQVRFEIDSRTADLTQADWPEDWDPAGGEIADIAGPCAGCQYRKTILRRDRCIQRTCYKTKKTRYRYEQAPARAQQIHAEHEEWWHFKANTWNECRACGMSPDDRVPVPAGETEIAVTKGGWLKSKSWRDALCNQCVERAGLEPTVQRGKSRPLGAQEPVSQVDASEDETPDMELEEIEPPPPAPKAVAVAARIMPSDSRPLEEWRVMVSIAKDGEAPDEWKLGSYQELAGLVFAACDEYFHPDDASLAPQRCTAPCAGTVQRGDQDEEVILETEVVA